ncbi:MAG TPA: MBL fold metallo-hydrolase [Longimicrobiales bacterium]|nr:MBL fold metallo-hydrolase [Longimicrobiales bacterium]
MRIAVLGSGSRGNATLVVAGETRLLVDAGFSGRDLESRLERVGHTADELAGILITHEHGDHTRGMGVLARRWRLPLYLTRVTHNVSRGLLRGTEDVRFYRATEPFRIGDLEIRPFLTAHDAADPVAVCIQDTRTGHRLGVATDLGRPTAAVRHALSGCDVLLLEANHDEVLLRTGPYPWSVKQRIASSHGHLSNQAAARLAADLWHEGLAAVVLAHLSDACNEPRYAEAAVAEALKQVRYRGLLRVAVQDEPLDWLDVGALKEKVKPAQLPLL